MWCFTFRQRCKSHYVNHCADEKWQLTLKKKSEVEIGIVE